MTTASGWSSNIGIPSKADGGSSPKAAGPPGESGNALSLAQRELKEEVGAGAETLTSLGVLEVAAGLTRQAFDVYLAEGLSLGSADREPSESDMVSAWHSESQLQAMIRSGRLSDAPSLAAYTLFLAHQ